MERSAIDDYSTVFDGGFGIIDGTINTEFNGFFEKIFKIIPEFISMTNGFSHYMSHFMKRNEHQSVHGNQLFSFITKTKAKNDLLSFVNRIGSGVFIGSFIFYNTTWVKTFD